MWNYNALVAFVMLVKPLSFLLNTLAWLLLADSLLLADVLLDVAFMGLRVVWLQMGLASAGAMRGVVAAEMFMNGLTMGFSSGRLPAQRQAWFAARLAFDAGMWLAAPAVEARVRREWASVGGLDEEALAAAEEAAGAAAAARAAARAAAKAKKLE